MDPKDASPAASASNPPRSSPGGLRRAVVVAGHERDAATARAHLDNGDPAVRSAALGALQRAGDLAPDDLRGAALDPEPTVRTRVAELAAVAGAGSSEATTHQVAIEEVLLTLLADNDDGVVEVAAFALGELLLTDTPDGADAHSDGIEAAPRRVSALAAVATSHQDALCREAAVAALGAIGHPGGLPAVLNGCGDRASVRRRAVLALSAFDGKGVTAMLEQLTADRDLQVSQAAEDLLAIETGENI